MLVQINPILILGPAYRSLVIFVHILLPRVETVKHF